MMTTIRALAIGFLFPLALAGCSKTEPLEAPASADVEVAPADNAAGLPDAATPAL